MYTPSISDIVDAIDRCSCGMLWATISECRSYETTNGMRYHRCPCGRFYRLLPLSVVAYGMLGVPQPEVELWLVCVHHRSRPRA